MDTLTTALGLGGVAVLMFVYIAPAAWAVGDAQRRGGTGAGIVFLFWLFGPFSALVWLLVRPRQELAQIAPDAYSSADDALAAAARLDQIGEWEAAISLYRITAKRWPEQQAYIAACIEAVREKQALATRQT